MVAKGYPSQPREKIRSWFREERVFQSSRSLRSYNIAPVPRIETYPRDGAVRKDTEDRRSLVNIEKSCGNFRTTLIFYEPSSVHVIHTAPIRMILFFSSFSFFFLPPPLTVLVSPSSSRIFSRLRENHIREERERERARDTLVRSYRERERKRGAPAREEQRSWRKFNFVKGLEWKFERRYFQTVANTNRVTSSIPSSCHG